jgi:hypothetical protein
MTILTPTSTAFSWISYDPDSHQLIVRFRDRTGYRYDNLPEHVFTLLSTSPSQGRYFNTEIRNHYPATRIESLDTPVKSD